MKIINILFYPLKLVSLGLIYFYKFIISPLIPKTCIYYPTCSNYMLLSIKEWGLIKGIYLGIRRLLKCTPFHHGGEDYVPINLKGDKKWIF